MQKSTISMILLVIIMILFVYGTFAVKIYLDSTQLVAQNTVVESNE